MNDSNCATCQVCYSCQGQEQVMGTGCGNCYTCQAGYTSAGPGPDIAPAANPGPPGPQTLRPRPVFDWEMRELNAKLDSLLVLLGKLVETMAPQDDKAPAGDQTAK